MRDKTGPFASPGFHLWQAALRWKAAVKIALEPHDLTPTQFFVLGAAGFLSRSAPPKQKDVAALAGLDLMTTSQVARALEADGLLARADDPHDSRSWLVTPTEKGRALLKSAAAAVRAADAAFFDGVDVTEKLEQLGR
jgi:DNA-binding MarR family transcriptional regulator